MAYLTSQLTNEFTWNGISPDDAQNVRAWVRMLGSGSNKNNIKSSITSHTSNNYCHLVGLATFYTSKRCIKSSFYWRCSNYTRVVTKHIKHSWHKNVCEIRRLRDMPLRRYRICVPTDTFTTQKPPVCLVIVKRRYKKCNA